MRLSRIGAGATLAIVILTAWLGACSSTDNEVCGIGGAKNGTCEQGAACPSGMAQIMTTDPADMCPGSNSTGSNWVCCESSSAAASSSTTTTAATDASTKG
jgi:hypothetical protein